MSGQDENQDPEVARKRSEFQEKHGCSPESYAERIAKRMHEAFETKQEADEQRRLNSAATTLHRVMADQFGALQAEGIIQSWSVLVRSTGEVIVAVSAHPEWKAILERRGLTVSVIEDAP